MSKNTPCSQVEQERFPPEKFPLSLYLGFGNRDAFIVEELKAILDQQPPDQSRYRKNVLKHVGNCVALHCYFKNVDALRPIAWHLQDKNLWSDTVLYEDRQLSPRLLIEKAQKVLGNALSQSV